MEETTPTKSTASRPPPPLPTPSPTTTATSEAEKIVAIARTSSRNCEQIIRKLQTSLVIAEGENGRLSNQAYDCSRTLGVYYFSKRDYVKSLAVLRHWFIIGARKSGLQRSDETIEKILQLLGHGPLHIEAYSSGLRQSAGYDQSGDKLRANGHYLHAIKDYRAAAAIEFSALGGYCGPAHANLCRKIAFLVSLRQDDSGVISTKEKLVWLNADRIHFEVLHPVARHIHDHAYERIQQGDRFYYRSDFEAATEEYRHVDTMAPQDNSNDNNNNNNNDHVEDGDGTTRFKVSEHVDDDHYTRDDDDEGEKEYNDEQDEEEKKEDDHAKSKSEEVVEDQEKDESLKNSAERQIHEEEETIPAASHMDEQQAMSVGETGHPPPTAKNAAPTTEQSLSKLRDRLIAEETEKGRFNSKSKVYKYSQSLAKHYFSKEKDHIRALEQWRHCTIIGNKFFGLHSIDGIEAILESKGFLVSQVEEYAHKLQTTMTLEQEGDDYRAEGKYEEAIANYSNAATCEEESLGGTFGPLRVYLCRKVVILRGLKNGRTNQGKIDWRRADLISAKWLSYLASESYVDRNACLRIQKGDDFYRAFNYRAAIEVYCRVAHHLKSDDPPSPRMAQADNCIPTPEKSAAVQGGKVGKARRPAKDYSAHMSDDVPDKEGNCNDEHGPGDRKHSCLKRTPSRSAAARIVDSEMQQPTAELLKNLVDMEVARGRSSASQLCVELGDAYVAAQEYDEALRFRRHLSMTRLRHRRKQWFEKIERLLLLKGHSSRTIDGYFDKMRESATFEQEGDTKRSSGEYSDAMTAYQKADAIEEAAVGGSRGLTRAYICRKIAIISALDARLTVRKGAWSKTDRINSESLDHFKPYFRLDIMQEIHRGDTLYRGLQFEEAIEQYREASKMNNPYSWKMMQKQHGSCALTQSNAVQGGKTRHSRRGARVYSATVSKDFPAGEAGFNKPQSDKKDQRSSEVTPSRSGDAKVITPENRQPSSKLLKDLVAMEVNEGRYKNEAYHLCLELGDSYTSAQEYDKALQFYRHQSMTGIRRQGKHQHEEIKRLLSLKGYSSQTINKYVSGLHQSADFEKEGDMKRSSGDYSAALAAYQQADAIEEAAVGGYTCPTRAYICRKIGIISALDACETIGKKAWSRADRINSEELESFKPYLRPDIMQEIHKGDDLYRRLHFEKAIEQYRKVAAIGKRRRSVKQSTCNPRDKDRGTAGLHRINSSHEENREETGTTTRAIVGSESSSGLIEPPYLSFFQDVMRKLDDVKANMHNMRGQISTQLEMLASDIHRVEEKVDQNTDKIAAILDARSDHVSSKLDRVIAQAELTGTKLDNLEKTTKDVYGKLEAQSLRPSLQDDNQQHQQEAFLKASERLREEWDVSLKADLQKVSDVMRSEVHQAVDRLSDTFQQAQELAGTKMEETQTQVGHLRTIVVSLSTNRPFTSIGDPPGGKRAARGLGNHCHKKQRLSAAPVLNSSSTDPPEIVDANDSTRTSTISVLVNESAREKSPENQVAGDQSN